MEISSTKSQPDSTFVWNSRSKRKDFEVDALIERVRCGTLQANAINPATSYSLIAHIAKSCMWSRVLKLLDLGADPYKTAPENKESSALYFIIKCGQNSLAMSIIEKGCDLVTVHAAVHTTIAYGQRELLTYLSSRGAVFDFRRAGAMDCVEAAVVKGFEDMVVGLLASKPSMEDLWIERLSYHLAHLACVFNRAVVLQALLENGVDPNLGDYQGQPVMHYAARAASTDCMAVLLRYGAHVDVEDEDCNTPLHAAATVNAAAAIRFLLDHGACINLCNRHKCTPLHRALHQRHIEAAQVLLAYNADIMKQCDIGATVLEAAVSCRYADLVREVLSRGAPVLEINAVSSQTILHYAVNDHYLGPRTLRMLLEHGAAPNARNSSGRTPLAHFCTLAAHFSQELQSASHVVGILLASGATFVD